MAQADSQTVAETVAKLTSLGYTITEPKRYTISELCDMKNKQGVYLTTKGNKRYYLDNKLHRTDGPAIECTDGYKAWHLNGERHRIDGPAIESTCGGKLYYVNGKKLSEQEFIPAYTDPSTSVGVPNISIVSTNDTHVVTISYHDKPVAVINIDA